MRILTKPLAFGALAVLVSACVNPGIVQLSPDTYLLSRVDKGGIFGNSAAMKASVIDEANSFAVSKGKIAIPISTNEVPMQIGRFASFDYQFRLVDPSDPTAKPTALFPRPNVVIEETERKSVDIQTTNKSNSAPDVYTELLKLDDLKKKGIITEQEFQAEKTKLLSSK